MTNNEKMSRQEISIKIEPSADMETTLQCAYYMINILREKSTTMTIIYNI